MKKIYSFTLIELLVVVGIIVILAGLLLPAVMGGAEQGRITQAKSDMKAILMALNQMETTYHKMVTPDSDAKYQFDGNIFQKGTGKSGTGVAWTFANPDGSSNLCHYIVLGGKSTSVKNGTSNSDVLNLGADADAAYKAFIAELCGYNKKINGTGITDFNFNTNVRRLKFLEPKSSFNPALGYDAADNANYLWMDPWGNPYMIMINTDYSDVLMKPSGSGYISAKAAIYSFGPNGTNDYGQNVATGSTNKMHDDITSWDN